MPCFATSDGLSIHYDDTEADGPPLLCLSGLTRNSADFDYVLPHLAPARVVRMDYRGRGRSDWDAPENYTIPVEARDALELLGHLSIDRAAILGTSRGGLIAMLIAATAKDRLTGVCLNDVGPVIAPAGLAVIKNYVGRPPAAATIAEAATLRAGLMAGFEGVPPSRWEEDAARAYVEDAEGLALSYDPALGDAVRSAGAEPAGDAWALFDALDGLPLAAIRGANSDILDAATFAEMRARRPDMIAAEVPGRGHVPFLDEPEAVEALRPWLTKL